MEIREFLGYKDGRDITKVEPGFLVHPTNNVIVYKGNVYKRPGIEAIGDIGADNAIIGQYVWKGGQAGELAVRATAGDLWLYTEPYKTGSKWTKIYSGIDTASTNVQFATWVDDNDPIIHSRMFFVDGSTDVHQWNGAVGVVDSVSGNTITLKPGKTAEYLGFDDGSGTAQTIIVNGTEYLYNNNPTGLDIVCTTAPAGVAAGDLVIAKPTVSVTTLTSFEKDFVYNYKNHLVLANLNSGQIYFSHVGDYPLNYTIPAPASRTAATAFYINLDGDVTAFTIRKDFLWISTKNDWFKLKKLDAINPYDLFVEINKNETTEANGALPFAVTSYKGNTYFIAQDKTMQAITDADLIQQDAIKLISDEVEKLLKRTNMNNVRMFSHERYIYIICPADNTLIMYDAVENYWQPPQYIEAASLAVIQGELSGHSNSKEASFKMFSGRQDFGVDFEADITFPYLDSGKEFVYKTFTKSGISGRMSPSAEVTWTTCYETNGIGKKVVRNILGTKVTFFTDNSPTPFGSVPFASLPFGGASGEVDEDIKRFYLFDGEKSVPYFEYQVKIVVSGDNSAFQLLGYMIEESKSTSLTPDTLYIQNNMLN